MAYKKLSEATLVESISDVANILIEENDEIKRVPKDELGGGSGVSSWNDLTDKPFGEKTVMGDTLTWDGDTEGLEVGTWYNVETQETANLVRVSELTPPLDVDTFEGLSISYTRDQESWTNYYDVYDSNAFEFVADNVAMIEGGAAWVVYDDNVTINIDDRIITLPQKGIYMFEHMSGLDNIVAITINGYNGFERAEITPLPNKYLDFIETVGGDTLTWDGNTEGLYNPYEGCYHVSDAVPTVEKLQNGGTIIQGWDNEDAIATFTNENVIESSVAGIGADYIVIASSGLPIIIATKDGAMVPLADEEEPELIKLEKAGIYFMFVKENSLYSKSLTINGYTGFPKEQVKQEYLPSGGGKLEYSGGFDAIISIDNDTNECTLLHGSYESVRNKMLSGICPSVWIYRTSGMDMYYIVSIVDINYLSNPNNIAFRIDADNPNTWVRLDEENNEVSYYVYED